MNTSRVILPVSRPSASVSEYCINHAAPVASSSFAPSMSVVYRRRIRVMTVWNYATKVSPEKRALVSGRREAYEEVDGGERLITTIDQRSILPVWHRNWTSTHDGVREAEAGEDVLVLKDDERARADPAKDPATERAPLASRLAVVATPCRRAGSVLRGSCADKGTNACPRGAQLTVPRRGASSTAAGRQDRPASIRRRSWRAGCSRSRSSETGVASPRTAVHPWTPARQS